MNRFATHQPVLKRAIELTKGRILEIGAGDGSTPFIHILAPGRDIITLETDPEWLERFVYMRSPSHLFLFADTYEKFDSLVRTYYDVVLIDHAPAERRNVEIEKAVNSRFVVIHDTHDPAYEYEKTLPLYKYHFKYDKLTPHTTVVSNIDDLSGFHDL